MANELPVGAQRVGDFIDFYPDTPPVNVTLEHSDQGISITLPWSDPDSPYAQWFMADMGSSITPPAPTAPPAPKRVLFQDSYGSVLLTRCRPRGFHANMLGPGAGTLWARAAIMGVDDNIDFDHPHGLRTEISGLREWLGVTSWDVTPERPALTLTSQYPPTIEVGAHKGIVLSFQPSWQMVPEEERDRFILRDLLRVATRSKEPMRWEDHHQLHRAVRDLLVISRWHVESCVEVHALRADDPLITLDRKEHGEQWRTVVMAQDKRAQPPSGHRSHLITYNELQPDGIRRWLHLRDDFARALDPVISSIQLRGTTANTLLAHTGPGLEALGYLLMLRDGAAPKAASSASLRDRLNRILKDLGDSLPFHGPTWANTTVAAYNGLKHANRKEPDPVDILNAWRESVMVVRAWVAAELGIPLAAVKERLASDPQRNAYTKIE